MIVFQFPLFQNLTELSEEVNQLTAKLVVPFVATDTYSNILTKVYNQMDTSKLTGKSALFLNGGWYHINAATSSGRYTFETTSVGSTYAVSALYTITLSASEKSLKYAYLGSNTVTVVTGAIGHAGEAILEY